MPAINSYFVKALARVGYVGQHTNFSTIVRIVFHFVQTDKLMMDALAVWLLVQIAYAVLFMHLF